MIERLKEIDRFQNSWKSNAELAGGAYQALPFGGRIGKMKPKWLHTCQNGKMPRWTQKRQVPEKPLRRQKSLKLAFICAIWRLQVYMYMYMNICIYIRICKYIYI